MKRYQVRLVANAALTINSGPQQIKFDDATVEFRNRDAAGVAGEPPQHLGLVIDAVLNESSIRAALGHAKFIARNAVEYMTFAHGAAIQDPEPWLAFDLDESKSDREMAQLVHYLPALCEA